MNPSIASILPLELLLGGSRGSPNSGLVFALLAANAANTDLKNQQLADKNAVQEFIKSVKITKLEDLTQYTVHKALYDKLPADLQKDITPFVST